MRGRHSIVHEVVCTRHGRATLLVVVPARSFTALRLFPLPAAAMGKIDDYDFRDSLGMRGTITARQRASRRLVTRSRRMSGRCRSRLLEHAQVIRFDT